MSFRSILRRGANSVRIVAADYSLIGGGLIGYHASRLSGRSEGQVNLRGVGPVTVRPRDSDLAALRQVFYGEEYRVRVPEAERALRQAYQAIVADGAVPAIVDAGANIGAATLWLRSEYPEAHIVAIEPDPATFHLLRRNTERDHRVTPIEAAIGAEPGHVRLLSTGESWATHTERAEDGTRVITMAEAFGEVSNGRPFIAKIDIEGFESDLFSKNLEWVDQVTAIFLEPHDWLFPGQHTSRSFQRALGERDFELFLVGENLLYVRL
jgi:FkbM family methyltransferase